MSRREHKLLCRDCGFFFKTTRKKDKHCPKCAKKREGKPK